MKKQNQEILNLLPVGIANSKNFTSKFKYLIAVLLWHNNNNNNVGEHGYFECANLSLVKQANMTEKNLLINFKKLEQMNFLIRKAGKRCVLSKYYINTKLINSYTDNNKKKEIEYKKIINKETKKEIVIDDSLYQIKKENNKLKTELMKIIVENNRLKK